MPDGPAPGQTTTPFPTRTPTPYTATTPTKCDATTLAARRAGRARSRTRERVAVRALIEAIQGETRSASDAAGQLRCHGSNDDGRCDVPPVFCTMTESFAGVAHTFAINASGRLRCSGSINHGQCEILASFGVLTQVDAGEAHADAIDASGQMSRFGSKSAKERRADSCRALLEAARGPVEDGRSSHAAAADDQTTLPQRCAQHCRSAAVGGPAGELVLSHALLVTGSVTWCRTCGAYADARVRGLRGRCFGPPVGRGGSGRTSIRRLMAGCHPLSGEHMGAKTMSLRATTWPVAAPGWGWPGGLIARLHV